MLVLHLFQHHVLYADEEPPEVTSPPFTPVATRGPAQENIAPAASLFGSVPSPKTVPVKASRFAEGAEKLAGSTANGAANPAGRDEQSSAVAAPSGWPSDFLKVSRSCSSGEV